MTPKTILLLCLLFGLVSSSSAHSGTHSNEGRISKVDFFGLFEVDLNFMDFFFIHCLVIAEIMIIIYGCYRFLVYLTHYENYIKNNEPKFFFNPKINKYELFDPGV